MFTIRYKIDKDKVLTTRISHDSTIGDLISQINNQHNCSKYKYVYSKDSGIILSNDDTILDFLQQKEDTIFYILEQREFDINKFENEAKGEDSTSYESKDEEEETSDKGHKQSETEQNNEGEDELLETQKKQPIKIKVKNNPPITNFDDDEFLIFSTQSYETMTNPTKIKLQSTSTYENTEKEIREALKISDDLQLHIYLSTGVLFYQNYKNEENNLGNFFSESKTNHNIYVIVTEPIDQEVLDEEFDEVCNVKDDKMKRLISPICGSTNIGFSRMACLLGTFFYKGVRTIDFIKSVARCTGFAPLISCLLSLYYREQIPKVKITGLTIATITASLHALFTKLLPSDMKPDKIFDRCLECSCYVVHIEETYILGKEKSGINEEQLRIEKYDLMNDVPNKIENYLINCGQKDCSFYPFLPDINEENKMNIVIIDKVPSYDQIELIFNQYRSYYPIPPLKIVGISITCIMRYINDQTLLFVNMISNKEGPNKVKVINPFVGKIETVDIKQIAKEVSENSGGNLELLIDPDDVEELNLILLDISGSMNSKLIDGNIATKPEESRFYSATKCIKTFLRVSFLYRLPNLFGFMTFNDDNKLQCDFSPLSAKIEETIVGSSIKCKGGSQIWDALDEAITILSNSKEEKKTSNAKLRIIVFSDGLDSGSKKTKEEICKLAIEKKVIVDSIALIGNKSSMDSLFISWKDLCNFSKFTGGYSYRSNNINELLSFFEKESFLSLKVRDVKNPANPDEIDHLFSTENNSFDTDINNLEWAKQSQIDRICTPNFQMKQAIKSRTINHRYELRLLKEMKIFQQKDDKDIKLFIKGGEIKSWKVYMRGPDESIYENKWWLLTIKFTEYYPLQPPIFRFINDLYHINVSEDGRVCASFLLSNYSASSSIYDLVVNIRDLLKNPDENYAIQEYKLNLWKTNRDQFYKNAKDLCKKAKDSIEDYIGGYKLDDDKNFIVNDNDFENDDDVFLKSTSMLYVSRRKKDHDTDNDDMDS